MKKHIALLACLLIILQPSNTFAQPEPDKLLIPIGGGYTDVYPGFIEAVFDQATLNQVQILVLPIAISSDPDNLSSAERVLLLKIAEGHRNEIEQTCKQAAQPGKTCQVVLAPILIHSDAKDPASLDYFVSDLAAIFILDGDQTVAMQVIADTPVETALLQAYENGIIIAGTGAGGTILSTVLLAGYHPGWSDRQSLMFGSVDIWNASEKRGLSFGIKDAIIDHNFYTHSRFGRLLNAITLPDVPHVGVGIDGNTGILVQNGTSLDHVFGENTVTILDAESYHSAEGVRYIGPDNLISLRNVLVHLLSPGDFSYGLGVRQHSLGAFPTLQSRQFDTLRLPPGAGSLILAGNLEESLENSPILFDFANLCGGRRANILIVSTSERIAQKYQASLPVTAQIMVVSGDSRNPVVLPPNITGILLIAKDQSQLQASILMPIKEAWLSGLPMMVDDAATALAGSYYSALSFIPNGTLEKSFQMGNTNILEGLDLLDIMVEPQIMENFTWGRLFSLAYMHPDLLALGIPDNTAIKITSQRAIVLGENVVFVLDLRSALLALGSNQGYIIANGLLDTYASGESLLPETANVDAAPLGAPTPVLHVETPAPPTPTLTSTSTLLPTLTPPPPTATSTRLSRVPPTRTPRPTSTPQAIPPPGDPDINNIMIVLAVVIVMVVLAGLWINRRRII